MKTVKVFFVLASTSFLMACGGGGEDATPIITSSAKFALDTAYTQAMTSGISLAGTAVDGADTWTLSLSVAPAADGTFEGVSTKKANQSLTMKKNGVTVLTSNIESFFTTNPLAIRGAKYSDGTYAVQTAANGALSNTAVVGNSGPFGTLTVYSNSSKNAVLLTQDSTWTLEADTATTAYGCVNSVGKNVSGVVVSTSSGCYKIDTDGKVLGMKYTLAVAGKTLEFR